MTASGQTLPSDGHSANDRFRAVSGSPLAGHVLPLSAETGLSVSDARSSPVAFAWFNHRTDIVELVSVGRAPRGQCRPETPAELEALYRERGIGPGDTVIIT